MLLLQCMSPLVADFVAKVFLGCRTKIPRAADASRASRREGPHRFAEKRPRPSYWRYGALQRWSCLKYYFREIFGVVRFSTFATKSATSRLMHAASFAHV